MGYHLGSVVLVTAAMFCLLTTLSSGARPEDFARRLGLKIADADGFNEIRAQYSGFFLAVAGVCTASLIGLISRPATFMVLGVVFGGLIAGRLAPQPRAVRRDHTGAPCDRRDWLCTGDHRADRGQWTLAMARP